MLAKNCKDTDSKPDIKNDRKRKIFGISLEAWEVIALPPLLYLYGSKVSVSSSISSSPYSIVVEENRVTVRQETLRCWAIQLSKTVSLNPFLAFIESSTHLSHAINFARINLEDLMVVRWLFFHRRRAAGHFFPSFLAFCAHWKYILFSDINQPSIRIFAWKTARNIQKRILFPAIEGIGFACHFLTALVVWGC